MTVSHDTAFRGRRQKVGTPVFTNTGKLNFFIGYCPECNGKCAVDSEEARRLMRMFATERTKRRQRVIVRLLRRYAYEA